jgi:chemotaxis protein CheD
MEDKTPPRPDAKVGFERKVVVGVGDLAVSSDHSVVLASYSLGSCLGITVYDPVVRVGGLLHLMLPDSSINSSKAAQQPAMFADTGLPALFRAACQMKAEKLRLHLCLAGGAQFMDSSGLFDIGRRNCEAVMALVAQHGLKVRAAQVGGLASLTVSLNVGTGEVRLKVSGRAEEVVLYRGA